MKLAGLASPDLSGELNSGNPFKLTVLVVTLFWTGVVKLTIHNSSPPELLLQVNVTLPPSGTAYPPGMGSASADRVTIKTKNTSLIV